MEEIRLEAVTIDGEYEGSKEEARDLVKQFLEETGDDVTTRYSKQVDEDGNVIDKEIRGYTRQSDIWWTSIAILVISNPEGVIQFLKFVKDIPGLTIGLTMEGNSRIKIFSDIDFTLIDNSTEYNVEKLGEVDDQVAVKMSEEDWRQLRDDIDTGEVDVELPPEDQIGP
ncbi:hypothetical protein [Halorarum halobium]|uniref:hypothetical protein n=1 Tax=Halorarum halobium TaxID=3075121 RepID=UPI0028B1852A|nr:hypothetical protein [Halobaculum sp. XH14]